MSGALRLDFGKRRGRLVSELDPEYLRWLTCRDVFVDEDGRMQSEERDDLDSIKWVRRTRPAAIAAARAFVDEANLCWHCCKRLVPIGDARANGKRHSDWDGRKLHKRCWKELLES
jgi:hypothetical protein